MKVFVVEYEELGEPEIQCWDSAVKDSDDRTPEQAFWEWVEGTDLQVDCIVITDTRTMPLLPFQELLDRLLR